MIKNCDVQFVTWIVFLVEIVNQVVADTQYCSDTGEKCDYPKTCCPGGCCYGADGHDNRHNHAYSFRVSFYNLWYFWFIVLFVLMSCFGGCGYYKQRQRFSRSRGVCGVTVPSQGGRSSRQPSTIRSGTSNNPSLLPSSHSNFGYTGSEYVRPGLNLRPPPYSEVMMQPDLYPAHKSELVLPPYPGTQQVSPHNSGSSEPSSSGLPQPPPYSLFQLSNQGSPGQQIHSPTDNQNADNNGSSPQNVSGNQ
ncbi:uncharacterized protein LOC110464361 [Mizuhopecten yessoensis]|uniref:WW domain binding protein VOPP1 n=1 Tax=Mizuhopecten yessoensis TaxID=6573 RepID=A0A210PU93_MIZYE|nr:uncharacterized protein LOC110464361 [Mizuhopecten yessoensis]OWF40025.1 hypothetical protein KP79_PYT19714 [Mizuhopecten yessoensis]